MIGADGSAGSSSFCSKCGNLTLLCQCGHHQAQAQQPPAVVVLENRIKLLEDEIKKLQWKDEGNQKRLDDLEARIRNMESGQVNDPFGIRGI